MFDETFISWFWSKVDRSAGPDGCWYFGETTFASHSERRGYTGVFYLGRTVGNAHRIACLLAHGPMADNLVARHLCNNPPCCNPKHVVPGTYAENTHDSIKAGRKPRERIPEGVRVRLTFPEDVYEDLEQIAATEGWTIPSLIRSIARKIVADRD